MERCEFMNGSGQCVKPGDQIGPQCSFTGGDYKRLCAVYPGHLARRQGCPMSASEAIASAYSRGFAQVLEERRACAICHARTATKVLKKAIISSSSIPTSSGTLYEYQSVSNVPICSQCYFTYDVLPALLLIPSSILGVVTAIALFDSLVILAIFLGFFVAIGPPCLLWFILDQAKASNLRKWLNRHK